MTELEKQLSQLQEENNSMALQLVINKERPASEGRENGTEEKIQKTDVQNDNHTRL